MRLTIKESKKEGTEITHASGEENYLNLTGVILSLYWNYSAAGMNTGNLLILVLLGDDGQRELCFIFLQLSFTGHSKPNNNSF